MSDTKSVKHEFKAEIKQLLNILVHSLYTNREIFVRELVSNASDALDKVRFESNKGTKINNSDLPLEIRLSCDAKENILVIEDTGIGMTGDELITNIGTIAKSGSADFIKKLSESKNEVNNIIGKFGVGFYSVFMVAKKVVLTTKSFQEGAEPVKWESDGLGSYELTQLSDDAITRGTRIEIHLNDESKEFSEIERIKSIIKTHSNFISFPIMIEKDQINTQAAIWREPKSSVKPEQYKEFYQFLTYDSNDPLEIIHKSIDAPIQFNALLFIPKKNMDMFGFSREDYGLDLYIRRVMIQHKNKDLLPEYLSFVKGVVDSEDIPLNISRETLQENAVFAKISSSVTQQVLSHLNNLAKNDPEKYAEFWKEHSQILKLGYSDYTNQEKFISLLRFSSSKTETDKLTSLDEYVERMKDKQKEIYYMTGASKEALMQDPHLEIFRKKDIEVLYCLEPIDEFVVSSLMKYKDFDFKSVDQADIKKIEKIKDAEESDKKSEKLSKDDETHFKSLLTKIKEILGDRVTDVKVSERLADSPACLVNPDNTMSAAMQKMMATMNKDMSIPKKIFEINKDNSLIRNLLEIFKKNPTDDFITNTVEQLFESSLLLEGYLQDPHKLVGRINSMLEQSSSLYKNK